MKPLLLLKKLLGVLIASAILQAAERDATNEISVLTLEQAWELAERLQPELAEAKALVDAAQGRAAQAGLFPNPAAIARIESAPVKGRTAGEAEYLAGVSQAIPLGGRLRKAREVDQLERDRLGYELEARRLNLRRRVQNAFATALYQDRAFQTQSGLVADTERLVAAMKARVEAGDALPEEMARAEMELARAQVELRRATSLQRQAMIELKVAIGATSLSVKSLGGNLESAFEIPTLESLLANLPSHPEATSADAAIRVRQAEVNLAKAARIPEVRVEALYRRLEGSKQHAFDVGVIIPIPVFDRNQGRLREARAELAAAEARARTALNTLNARLYESHAQLTAALANSRTLNSDVLPRAQLVRRAAEARFDAGDMNLADLLPVRRDWAAAQLTYLESLRDVMQAWAELSRYHALP